MIPGHASNNPMDLCPCVREKYYNFLRIATDKGLHFTLTETLRDLARQEYYLEHGTSKTLNSYHLPHAPYQKSLAFDFCPTDYLKFKDWCPGGPLWAVFGGIGRTAGLEWGGDWQVGDDGWRDLAHLQQKKCTCYPAPTKETR